MNAAFVFIGYAAAAGFLGPRLLLSGTWPHRAPALAVAAWYALAASFVISVLLAVYHVTAPDRHAHTGLLGILTSCGLAPGAGALGPDRADLPSLMLPLSVALLVAGAFGYEVLAARLHRSRHLEVLDLVGRPAPQLRATVLDHALPAAYCLPGRRSRVVVSQGALQLLSADQLDAVLEHERAHIAGRHHLATAAAGAFGTVFRWVPLGRRARQETALLLEMIADDRALRSHSREVLATAMYEMAAAKAPQGAFAVGGTGALLRLQRVLTPGKQPHPALRAALATAVAVLPLLPLLVACTAAVSVP